METTLITDLTYVEAPAAPAITPSLRPTMLTSRLRRAWVTALFSWLKPGYCGGSCARPLG